jgi:hypothetical protein
MWLKKFVPELRVVDSIERALKLYCDNKPALLYSHNNKKTKAAKHINIRFYVMKEKKIRIKLLVLSTLVLRR